MVVEVVRLNSTVEDGLAMKCGLFERKPIVCLLILL